MTFSIMGITRQNHYVPEWYQKRFLSSEKSDFYYLNLFPSVINSPDGGRKKANDILWPFKPSQCFCLKDLYTTHYYGFLNDEIERYLFGKIDNTGAKAINAMAKQEFESLHANFLNFFEYIDAQKIRTPKGLAWVKSRYPSLTHNQLLYEMQRIRQLHCTIWSEAVREIVYATNSKIKFIVSDHPVTIYNLSCPSSSQECTYPNDPRIEMKATQTIFPLDSNRCLILTNLDYARNPDLHDPKAFRPNANPFRSTLVRMDNTIHKRELQENEVATINLIIKLRAKQFLAAESKEWLYPERVVRCPWPELGKVLLPPKDELYHYGGEIYVGYEDGSSSYHDEYGRTRKELSYLKKEPIQGKISPNAPCSCGSGKKYKKCCRDKPKDERPSSTERSIRERNLKFFDILVHILGFNKTTDWTEIRRSLTDQKIADIHKAVAALWPLETDLMSLLPKPDAKVSRALYSGLLDPTVAYKNIAEFLLYADEILMLNPFPNPNILRKEFNPIDNPSQYRQATLKNIIFFISFIPLIQSGHINLIPDPTDFNLAFKKQIMDEAEKRRNQVELDDKSIEPMKKMAMEDYKRFLFSLPEDSLKNIIRKTKPEISDEDLGKTIEYIKKTNEQDPLAPLHPPAPGKDNGQMLVSHLSPNLELGMFLAQATGSFILTHHPYRWSEICSSVNYFYGDHQSPWDSIATHMTNYEIDFVHLLDHKDFLSVLSYGEFRYMRVALRNVWNAVQAEQPISSSQIDNLIKEIDSAREKMSLSIDKFMERKNEGCQEYLRVARTKAKLSSIIAPAGHSTSAVYRLLLAHAGHEKYLKALPLSLYIAHNDVQDEKTEE
jgi:hypothetical protein